MDRPRLRSRVQTDEIDKLFIRNGIQYIGEEDGRFFYYYVLEEVTDRDSDFPEINVEMYKTKINNRYKDFIKKELVLYHLKK